MASVVVAFVSTMASLSRVPAGKPVVVMAFGSSLATAGASTSLRNRAVPSRPPVGGSCWASGIHAECGEMQRVSRSGASLINLASAYLSVWLHIPEAHAVVAVRMGFRVLAPARPRLATHRGGLPVPASHCRLHALQSCAWSCGRSMQCQVNWDISMVYSWRIVVCQRR